MTLIYLIFLVIWGVKVLRWLGFVQQKEYRADRLWLFIKSKEGTQELIRVLPNKSDFSRTGLKRPKITPRVMMVFLTLLIINLILGWWLMRIYLPTLDWLPTNLIVSFLFTGIALIVFTPIFTLLSILPSKIIADWRINLELKKAQQILAQKNPLIIGVTGSYGKSSTKHLLSFLLSSKFSVFKTPKSFNTRYSVAKSIVDGYRGESVVVLEYGAYTTNEIAILTDWFLPKISVVTGVVEQHLGLFTSLEKIIAAKSELVAAVEGGGSVFYNDADLNAKRVVDLGILNLKHTDPDSITVLPVSKQEVVKKWRNPKLNDMGRLEFFWGNKKVESKLVGEHYFEVLKIAVTVAEWLDVAEDDLISGIEKFVPPELFVKSYQLQSKAVVIDDGGTANPKGFEAMLSLTENIKQKRKAVLVFSGIVDLGHLEQQIHLKLAKKASKIFDKVLYLSAVGQTEFHKHFGENLVAERENIEMELRSINSNTILVIEGRMPGWLSNMVSKMKD